MTANTNRTKRKLPLFQLAEEIGNVSNIAIKTPSQECSIFPSTSRPTLAETTHARPGQQSRRMGHSRPLRLAGRLSRSPALWPANPAPAGSGLI